MKSKGFEKPKCYEKSKCLKKFSKDLRNIYNPI